ncbi:hypothetical protein EDD11_009396, partial [Mortierella claussenii]
LLSPFRARQALTAPSARIGIPLVVVFVGFEINIDELATVVPTMVAHQLSSPNAEMMRSLEAKNREFENVMRKMNHSVNSMTKQLTRISFSKTDEPDIGNVKSEIAAAVSSGAASTRTPFRTYW